jgi:hypothetical protein
MKLPGMFRGQASRPTSQQLHDAKEVLDAQLEDLRARRAEVTGQLQAARGRKEGLAVEVATAVLDGETKPSSVRRDHVAAAAEVDALELALAIAAERIATLEAQTPRAGRRVKVATALEQMDGLAEEVQAVEEAWPTMRNLLERVIHAHDDVAPMLDSLSGPGFRHGISRERLGRILLWRIADLIGVSVSAHDRVPLREVLSYPSMRERLERELADVAEEETV